MAGPTSISGHGQMEAVSHCGEVERPLLLKLAWVRWPLGHKAISACPPSWGGHFLSEDDHATYVIFHPCPPDRSDTILALWVRLWCPRYPPNRRSAGRQSIEDIAVDELLQSQEVAVCAALQEVVDHLKEE